MSKDYCKYDMARLRTELEQEREIKDMLEESVRDLQSTMRELQDRLNGVDGEENEWKTRYETQTEVNVQLQRQLVVIHERLEDLRGNPVDRLASIRSFDDMPPESLRHHLKLLVDEKSGLQSQLADCRVGIEQEAKVFHKTNDERRAYISEIAKLSSTMDAQRKQYSVQPRRATESKLREKQPSRKSEADTKKGKVRESDGGRGGRGGCVKGGGGGEGELKKSHLGSRLPTLKHHVKH
ncbi:coiled-coil domain containing 169 isoform X4 [Syngnathoides biaculeatus]|uniref:coiled-coil domain containing 169 isoform X4 n=1 Tax=Syngnathoides biaculeatus TaxID=300417 RepID=UPI002ADE58D6|nr:coiled-coil domain containing 169 isoform X4 [Syngnathoides biaculeatus]